jgi:hypothetical protein
MVTSNFPSDSIQFIREACVTDLLPKERPPAGIEGDVQHVHQATYGKEVALR